MKRIIIAALVVLSFFTFCGRRFGVGDRFEGVQKDTLRVYVRINNSDKYDGRSGEAKLKEDFQLKGKERARLLAVANPEIADRGFSGAVPDDGKPVFMECGDDYCEAFLDFSLKPGGVEAPVKKTEGAR